MMMMRLMWAISGTSGSGGQTNAPTVGGLGKTVHGTAMMMRLMMAAPKDAHASMLGSSIRMAFDTLRRRANIMRHVSGLSSDDDRESLRQRENVARERHGGDVSVLLGPSLLQRALLVTLTFKIRGAGATAVNDLGWASHGPVMKMMRVTWPNGLGKTIRGTALKMMRLMEAISGASGDGGQKKRLLLEASEEIPMGLPLR